MGNFYVNYTLRGPSQRAVGEMLAGRSSIVTPWQAGCTVVFDEESEEQNEEVIGELASKLSGAFHCPLLAVLNHDDDILGYQLYIDGELEDEYCSTPGYFAGMGDELENPGGDPLSIEPEGGNAKKICDAFGAESIQQVETILRRRPLEDGYTFAFERHQDLVEALRLPQFAVGCGFENVANDELPDDLSESDLLRTKDLTVPVEATLRGIAPKSLPGYYKISFRAHPKLQHSIPTAWMPAYWADLECSESQLSEKFLHAVAQHREEFRQLGFSEQGFKVLGRVLNPNYRDGGGINYLDKSRCYHGQLIYNRSYLPTMQSEKESVVIAFTAVFEREILSCTNAAQSPLDSVPGHTVIRIKSGTICQVFQEFQRKLEETGLQPSPFGNLSDLQTWYDSNVGLRFRHNVARGVLVRMSKYEVDVAKRKLPPNMQAD